MKAKFRKGSFEIKRSKHKKEFFEAVDGFISVCGHFGIHTIGRGLWIVTRLQGQYRGYKIGVFFDNQKIARAFIEELKENDFVTLESTDYYAALKLASRLYNKHKGMQVLK